MRRGVLVISDSGAPPQALGIFGVLPKIIDIAVAETAEGDAVGGIQHLQDIVVIFLVAGAGLELSQRFFVLVRYPGQWFGAMHLFQPGIRIVRHIGGHGMGS